MTSEEALREYNLLIAELSPADYNGPIFLKEHQTFNFEKNVNITLYSSDIKYMGKKAFRAMVKKKLIEAYKILIKARKNDIKRLKAMK